MEIIQAIKTRRSIRKFNTQTVLPDVIRQLLDAAMSAPSAGNQQPWHFVVIDQRRILDQVPAIHPYAGFCKDAPLAYIWCAATPGWKNIRVSGSRTVRPPRKTFCLQPMPRAWEPSGPASTRSRNAFKDSANCWICPKRSFPWPWSFWDIPTKHPPPRNATGKIAYTGTCGKKPSKPFVSESSISENGRLC